MSSIRNLAAALVALALLTACQRSAEQLVDAVDDKPGVISVDVQNNGGENDIPGHSLPWVITIEMRTDSTAAQIKDVTGEFEEDMKDEEVESLTIRFGDRGYLEMGLTTGETEPWAEAYGTGLQDPRVNKIFGSAWRPGASLNVKLRSADFDDLRSFATEYRRVVRVADLEVRAGAFSFIAKQNPTSAEDARATAKLRTATAVDERFRLAGARIWGSAPLRLVVGPGPALATVRAFASKHAAPGTGPIMVVRAKSA